MKSLCAMCWELESFAKIIWACVRFGSYLSVIRPESHNSDKKKCSVHQYPQKETSPQQMVYENESTVSIFLKPFYIF